MGGKSQGQYIVDERFRWTSTEENIDKLIRDSQWIRIYEHALQRSM